MCRIPSQLPEHAPPRHSCSSTESHARRPERSRLHFHARLLLGACLASSTCAFSLQGPSPGALRTLNALSSSSAFSLGPEGPSNARHALRRESNSLLQVSCSAGVASTNGAESDSRPSGFSRRKMCEGMAAGAVLSTRLVLSPFDRQERTPPAPARFEVLPLYTNEVEQEIQFWTRALGMTVHNDGSSLLVSFSTHPRENELALGVAETSYPRSGSSQMLDVQIPFRPQLLHDIELAGGQLLSSHQGELLVSSPSGQQLRIEQLQASVVVAPTLRVARA